MKKKVIILVVSGILTVGGISAVYARDRNSASLNQFSRPMMSIQNSDSNSLYNYSGTMMNTQNSGIQSDNFNNMIKMMIDNGFIDGANAMENGDLNAMNKFMLSLSDNDYKTMIDIMQKNGYGTMANMMQSIGREGMTKIHQGMMGKY